MDGALNFRKQKLLDRLAARVNHDGTPKKGYEENVACIRAELQLMEAPRG